MKTKRHRHRKRREFRRQTAPGAAPGVVAVDPSEPAPKIKLTSYDGASLEEKDHATVADIKNFLGKRLVTWIDVEGLGDAATLEQLGAVFGIHRLALEDVVNTHQRSKAECYGDYLYFVAPMMCEPESCVPEQLSLFLGSNYVLTFQQGTPGDCFDPIRKRLENPSSRVRTSAADYLAYEIIDSLIDSYYPVLEAYGTRLEDLEDELVSGAGSLDTLHTIRHDLRLIRRAIWPQREAIAAMMRDTMLHIRPETKVYLRDCYDHVVQLIDLVETYRELCADQRDLYMSTLSNRINETMRVLTIISTVFIPLTFIAGIYGMNFDTHASVWNMPELRWRYGYVFCIVLMAATATSMIWYFVLQGWIRAPWSQPLRLKPHSDGQSTKHP